MSSAVIGYAWVFVQFRTYAVADKISYHRVTASFDILLNSVAYVTDTVEGKSLFNSLIQTPFCGVKQSLCVCTDFATGECKGVVAVKSPVESANIHAYYVALF